jgi:L-seryl-tRNA(Ser) seleniumtransferase
MTPQQLERLRSLPAIGQLLEHPAARAWMERRPRQAVVDALQGAVEEIRRRLLEEGTEHMPPSDSDSVMSLAEELLARSGRPSLRPVINATGVVLHTGLGRTPLCAEAVHAVAMCATGYSNLEMDLESGARGRRTDHVVDLLKELTGAEAATVVNNNAAAMVLILNTVAKGSEVIVSRGELVEIGGSFRLPDILSAGGAILREVGTTNRTRVADFERAINDNTAALMRVHTSNYRVVGFTESTPFADLAALAKRSGKIAIDDLGSGAMVDLGAMGLPPEPHVRASVDAGADLICFSGDKLLGGPQAGIILGRSDLVRRIEKNPLMRTYRVDKMTLAALEATLRLYRDPAHALRHVPSLAMLTADMGALLQRARKLCKRLRAARPEESFEVVSETSVAGGGSIPGREMETYCVSWKPAGMSVDDALVAMRLSDPALVARAKNDRVLFDVRTIHEEELGTVVEIVGHVSGA